MRRDWTPVQERVMNLVYGDPGKHNWWIAPCGHGGFEMTIDAQGLITCHHTISQQHGPGCFPWQCTPECVVTTCGHTYTESDVHTHRWLPHPFELQPGTGNRCVTCGDVPGASWHSPKEWEAAVWDDNPDQLGEATGAVFAGQNLRKETTRIRRWRNVLRVLLFLQALATVDVLGTFAQGAQPYAWTLAVWCAMAWLWTVCYWVTSGDRDIWRLAWLAEKDTY